MTAYTQVIELAKAGMRPSQIEPEVGIKRGTIYTYISNARSKGISIPRFSNAGIAHSTGTRFSLRKDISTRLKPQADRRNISVSALAHTLLETIANSDLVDAVLDDREEIQ